MSISVYGGVLIHGRRRAVRTIHDAVNSSLSCLPFSFSSVYSFPSRERERERMETHNSVNMAWSNCGAMVEKEDYQDIFSFLYQLAPLDHFRGYSAWNFFSEFGFQETTDLRHVSLLDMFLSEPFFLDCAPNYTLHQEGFIGHSVSESGVWNEKDEAYDSHQQQQQMQMDNTEKMSVFEQELPSGTKKSNTRSKQLRIENSGSDSKRLSKKIISQYFYMPIKQAAIELNVGLTHLKKRCRELGIRRWPRRKLMSLQTLIKNVQKLSKEEIDQGEMTEAITILEQQKKLMEEIPDMELQGETKRLRQACFKEKYKRKLMGIENTRGSVEEDDDDDQELKSFFSDLFPTFNSSNIL